MTNLNGAQAQAAPTNAVAIAGIVSGAVVVGVLAIAVALAIRRPSRSPATRLVFNEDVPVVKNPALSYPPTPEFDSMGRSFPIINNTAQKNPFAPKGTSVRFSPMAIRNTMTSFNIPPPPPLDI
jgi:hypothetical protein